VEQMSEGEQKTGYVLCHKLWMQGDQNEMLAYGAVSADTAVARGCSP
jgi:hypothetical protein